MGSNESWLTSLIAAIGLISALFHGEVLADERRTSFDISVGATYLSGYTDYKVGGNVVWDNFPPSEYHFPTSELDWPLDTMWATLRGQVFYENWRLEALLQKNLTKDPGNMEDRDWGVYPYPQSSPDTLDILGIVETEMDAWAGDINADYTFYRTPEWSFFTGLGYTYQQYDFEGQNVTQIQRNPSGGAWVGYRSGDVINYEVAYHIPYARVGTTFIYKDAHNNEKFYLEGSFAYSPIVRAEDEDNHLLRGFTARSTTDGDAFIVLLKSRYNVSPQWFVGLNFNYTTINADGTTRVEYPGSASLYNYSMDVELTSQQLQSTFEIGYRF